MRAIAYSDGELLPDDYEAENRLDPSDPVDGATDNDGDSESRGREFLLGTSDFDRTECGVLPLLGSYGSSSIRGFDAKDQKAYRIFKSYDLIEWEIYEDFDAMRGA